MLYSEQALEAVASHRFLAFFLVFSPRACLRQDGKLNVSAFFDMKLKHTSSSLKDFVMLMLNML